MNKKGSTLVMTIFLVMIISVLGFSLMLMSVTDKRLIVQQEDQMESYYIARSAVDTVAYYMVQNPLEIPNVIGKDFDAFQYFDGSNYVPFTDGTVLLSVTDLGSSNYDISATATVDDRSDTVLLSISRISMEHAIFTINNLDVTAMDEVHGDLGSNGWIDDSGTSGRSGYDNYEYMDLTIHTQLFPTLTLNGSINENSSYVYDQGSYEYTNIRLNMPSGTITFDTTAGDIHIVVSDYYSKGSINIIGGNKVYFYIRDAANIQTPSLNVNDPDDLIFYLAKGAVMSLSTPLGFNGRIIGPEADVSMSANSSLTGSVIAENFYGTSNSNIYFDEPDDDYLVTGYRYDTWR
jgi:hypothetical protein